MENDEDPVPASPEPDGSSAHEPGAAATATSGNVPAPRSGATTSGEGDFMESWAHPDPNRPPPEPPPARRIPRVVWRVVSVVVFLGFLAFAFLGPIRGSLLCPHPGTAQSLPLRIVVALIGFGIARGIWILGGTEAEPWRYVGPGGGPRPVERQGRRRTGAWWALLPWFIFLGFVAALFLFHLGDCG